MPAVSDASGATPEPPSLALPHTWRPVGPRIMGIALLVALYGLCGFCWWAFGATARAQFSGGEIGTLIFFGVLILVAVYALVRSRVEAHDEGLVVVNGFRRRQFEWAEVVSVSMPPGAPWVTLDLADGNTVSAMGIQASDGNRSRVAVRQLRRLTAEKA